MFRHFHKYFKKCKDRIRTRPYLVSQNGQVAVILILVVAAALIFYAVSLNLSRVSQSKTLTTIAADTGAATLGSYMASYGQQVYMTSLGGHRKICGWTGVVAAIVAVVAAIIAVILAAPTGGASLAVWVKAMAIPLAGLLLATGALVIQLAVIQPTMSSMWNDYIFGLMVPQDAFVEQGIQTALSASVTDQVAVPDVTDFDQDRIFGFDINGKPLDTISRFGFYYQKRLDTIPPPLSTGIQNFLDALRGFVYDNGDHWGIVDGFMDYQNNLLGPSCAPFDSSSECDPCCVEDPGMRPPDLCGTPPSALVPLGDALYQSIQPTCEANSPYGTAYPWVYDPYRGYPANGFDSFQEQIGRDDEHQLFEKIPAAPNGVQTAILPAPSLLPPINFKLKDTTRFYTPLVYPPWDNRTGVFPFFYKIADWKVNLNLTAEPFDLIAKPNQCHWCDQREPSVGPCPPGQPPEIPQLVLDPATPPSGAVYNTTLCVDGPVNPPSVNPPLAVDKVKLPDATTGIIEATPDQCAQNALGNRAVGFWKRGGDRFCSTSWPYYGNCPKEGTCTDDAGCTCGQGNPGNTNGINWPDDLLDDLEYGLNDFANWARNILAQSASSLARDLNNWYPEAAQWIERGTAAGATNSPTCTSCCYVCDKQDGTLWRWYDEIREMKARLEAWRNTSFVGTSCTDVWCVPPAACPGGDDAPGILGSPNNLGPESATFNANGGNMVDVVACLNWNVNDTVTASDGTTATGNEAKFRACHTACQAAVSGLDAATALRATELCSALPRSLVPGFDAIPFVAPDAGAATTGSCGDAAFMTPLDQSAREAGNQVVKFRKRYAFLSARLKEMDNIISILNEAETKFLGFLTCADVSPADGQPDGAACKLIKDRIGLDSRKTGLPYHAIYGWQNKDERGQPPGLGKWHIVRVDARIPKRCDLSCNADQIREGGDPLWPWVKTYTKNWGTKRCYELTDTMGVVKVRVSRYDETSPLATLLFPNAVEIWKPSFTRSDRPERASPNDIEAVCVRIPSMAPDLCATPPCPLGLGSNYYGAFLLNERLDNVRDPVCIIRCSLKPDPAAVAACEAACPIVGNVECWKLANYLLTQGVTSEACAQYYYHEGKNPGAAFSGMDFKFVPCANF